MHWSLSEGETLIGRDPDAPVFLDDVTVSRHHAALHLDQGQLTVQDLGSTNGTYVNGKRTDSATIGPGDEVFIGRFHLVVARGG